jgi:cell division protein FtsN
MYKVQIGAFRNPIQQDVFKGISPIIGERNNAGFTRYSAGEFNNLSSADNAKGRIQSLGYRDAFVVAYYNGKRITIAQAQALERGENIAATNNNNNPAPSLNRPITNQFIKQGPIEINAVENMRGAFYTIQVGVFSKPVTSAEIFNITPLQQENLSNGLYRYTTGKFNNLNDAEQAKNEARTIGIADAFITAYRDGQRVTVASIGGAQSQQTTTSTTTSKGYSILIGTYTDRVPVAVASKILSLSNEGIEKKVNADGSKSYFYGNYSDKTEAEAVVSRLKTEGISDASVVEQP